MRAGPLGCAENAAIVLGGNLWPTGGSQATFAAYWGTALKPGGLYFVEDTHVSFSAWRGVVGELGSKT